MNVSKVGSFIREQRTKARLSLRHIAGSAGVSIPYLSQVERGLRRPSAEILQAIARALRISAETLYVQAGILEDRPAPDVVAAVMADVTISERQRHALIQIYEAFRSESSRGDPRGGAAEGDKPPPRSAAPARKPSKSTRKEA